MFLDEEYKKELERKSEEMCKRIKKNEEEIERVIKEQYNGDEIAYHEDTFDMLGAMLLTGLGIDEIRRILLEKLPKNSDRIAILMNASNGKTMEERFVYPGGYNSYVEDVYNGYYGTFNEG